MKKNRKWAEDDEVYLEYYLYNDDKEKSYDAAALFLGRSKRSVKKKVWRMRKDNPRLGYIYRPYTTKEKDFIRKHYATMTAKNIGKRLNRTSKSVLMKALEMGLKKSVSVKDYELQIRDLANKGFTDYEMEKELKIKRQSISYFRRKNGI